MTATMRLRTFASSLTPEPELTDLSEDAALERSTKQVYEIVGARGILRRAVVDDHALQPPEQEVLQEVVGISAAKPIVSMKRLSTGSGCVSDPSVSAFPSHSRAARAT